MLGIPAFWTLGHSFETEMGKEQIASFRCLLFHPLSYKHCIKPLNLVQKVKSKVLKVLFYKVSQVFVQKETKQICLFVFVYLIFFECKPICPFWQPCLWLIVGAIKMLLHEGAEASPYRGKHGGSHHLAQSHSHLPWMLLKVAVELNWHIHFYLKPTSFCFEDLHHIISEMLSHPGRPNLP